MMVTTHAARALSVLAVLAAASSTGAQTVRAITSPVWLQRPSGDAIGQLFPIRARRWLVSGKTEMTCIAKADGALDQCKVSTEIPTLFGFRDAALKLAPLYRLAPTDGTGAPVAGGTVTLPITWRIERETPGNGAVLSDHSATIAWSLTPTQAQLDAVYPSDAAGLGLALLHCTGTADGGLRDCTVGFDSPVHRGFGNAALQLTSLFKAAPTGGSLDQKKIDVPVEFYPPTEARWDLAQPFVAAGHPSMAHRAVIFERLPNSNDIAAAYPPQAGRIGQMGSAMIGCVILDSGAFSGCRVLDESPPGGGFGDAALKLSDKFRIKTVDKQGVSIVGDVFQTRAVFKLVSCPAINNTDSSLLDTGC